MYTCSSSISYISSSCPMAYGVFPQTKTYVDYCV